MIMPKRSAGEIAIVAVSGVKDSGKTTLLTRILPLLRERGLRVAVVKHDGHDFEPDMEGTDSYRLREAGAEGVAVYSSRKWMLVREQAVSLKDLIGCFRDMDLVLLEGGKHSSLPKLELVRDGVSERSVCDPSTLLALCTNTSAYVEGVPCLGLEEYGKIVDLIVGFLGKGTRAQ